MKLSGDMAAMLCNASCERYDGGSRKLFAGDTPIGTYVFGSPAFGPLEIGTTGVTRRVLGNLVAQSVAGGKITRFVDYDSSGAELLSGSVGSPESGADCLIGAMPTRAGQPISIESMFWFQPYE